MHKSSGFFGCHVGGDRGTKDSGRVGYRLSNLLFILGNDGVVLVLSDHGCCEFELLATEVAKVLPTAVVLWVPSAKHVEV